jgi:DNA-binding transcriptional MerR regulator
MKTESCYCLGASQHLVVQPPSLYSIDGAAQAVALPRHFILVCCKHGLLSPQMDPVYGGYYFAEDDIQRLERIRYLQCECGVNLTGIKIIFGLMGEVERLRARLSES